MSIENKLPLTDEESTLLDEFLLSAEEGDDSRMPIDEAHGYLTALIVGHAQVSMEDALNAVWEKPNFKDAAEQEQMTGYLMRMYQDISNSLEDGDKFEPMAIEIEDEGETLVAYEGWCFGFMIAVTSDEERWTSLPKNEQSLLSPIAKLALLYADEEVEMEDDEYEMLADLLPGSAVALHHYWLSIDD